jgi:hypothetical protein
MTHKIIKKTYIQVIMLLSLLTIGCGPTYLLEYNDHQFYVEYPKDEIVTKGDEFEVYKHEKKKVRRTAKPAPPQYINVRVGKIVITGIADTSHGFVKIVSGEIEKGFMLKKSEVVQQAGQE